MDLKDVQVTVGTVEVTPDGMFLVPINISDLTGLNVTAYEMEISSGDEADFADVEDISEAGTLTEGWMNAFNNNHMMFTPDFVRLAVANTRPAVGGGVLVNLKVKGQKAGSYQPKVTFLMLGETVIFGKSSLDTSIPVPPPPQPPVEPTPSPVQTPIVVVAPAPPVATSSVSVVYRTVDDKRVLWGYQYYNTIDGHPVLIRDITIPAPNKEDAEEWNALTGMSIPVPSNGRYDVPPALAKQLNDIRAAIAKLE